MSSTQPAPAASSDNNNNKKRPAAATSAPPAGSTPPPPTKKKAAPAVPTTTSTAAAAAADNIMAPTARGTATSNASKPYKGLRHFSMMVCKKVEEKGTTTYNQVADELVVAVLEDNRQPSTASGGSGGSGSTKFDEKNIRRRVYDALNVLMAMDIISKEKKEITWRGLPTSAAEDVGLLQRELVFRQHELARKRATLQELLTQQVCFRNLVRHNADRSNEKLDATADNKIPLPFIVVNTSSAAVIQCNMSRDLTDVMFDFSLPFEINDDNTILKKLGMHRTTETVLRQMLPADMYQYCRQHDLFDPLLEKQVMNVDVGGGTDPEDSTV